MALTSATSRRKFLALPWYPAALASTSSRLAEIRPWQVSILPATTSLAPSKFLSRRTATPASARSAASRMRFTVLWVVPQIAAAPRKIPASL